MALPPDIRLEEVYPRVCGGTVGQPSATNWHLGLSPRVRGNRGHIFFWHHIKRSIPACAGEPGPL